MPRTPGFVSGDMLLTLVRERPLAMLLAALVARWRELADLALSRGNLVAAADLEEQAALASHRLGVFEDEQLDILRRDRSTQDRQDHDTHPTAASQEDVIVQDGIVAWVSELRGRLTRGELDGLGPLGLDDGTEYFSTTHIVRIMLNDLDDLDTFDQGRQGDGSPPSDHDVAERRARRFELLSAFLRLREVIG